MSFMRRLQSAVQYHSLAAYIILDQFSQVALSNHSRSRSLGWVDYISNLTVVSFMFSPKCTFLQVGKPKVSVTFALNSNGLLEVSKAELALEMLERSDHASPSP